MWKHPPTQLRGVRVSIKVQVVLLQSTHSMAHASHSYKPLNKKQIEGVKKGRKMLFQCFFHELEGNHLTSLGHRVQSWRTMRTVKRPFVPMIRTPLAIAPVL